MPRRRAHLSTPRTRSYRGIQWIRNADGVWGTLEWHLVGRREWYYGWPNPYLWPRDEDGQFSADDHTDGDAISWVPVYEYHWERTRWITWDEWHGVANQ